MWRGVHYLQSVEVDYSIGSREELREGVGYLLRGELGEGVALWFKERAWDGVEFLACGRGEGFVAQGTGEGGSLGQD